MAQSGTTMQVLLPPSAPDRLFRVGPMRWAGEGLVEASMTSGRWSVGPDGRPGVAALCVLLDAVLGQATVFGRSAGLWPVTTEMTVDMAGPVPAEGEITVRAWLMRADGRSVLARGDVLGPDGELIGAGTEWGRLIDDVPDGVDSDDPAVAIPASDQTPPDGDAAGVLGAYLASGNRYEPEARPALTLPGSPALVNERDTVHGGILAAVAELAAVAALPGTAARPLVTGSLHVTYLRPAGMDGPTTVHTTTVHSGRSFGVVRADVRNSAGRIAAAATVTRRALD